MVEPDMTFRGAGAGAFRLFGKGLNAWFPLLDVHILTKLGWVSPMMAIVIATTLLRMTSRLSPLD